jgi:hypothetical protein
VENTHSSIWDLQHGNYGQNDLPDASKYPPLYKTLHKNHADKLERRDNQSANNTALSNIIEDDLDTQE